MHRQKLTADIAELQAQLDETIERYDALTVDPNTDELRSLNEADAAVARQLDGEMKGLVTELGRLRDELETHNAIAERRKAAAKVQTGSTDEPTGRRGMGAEVRAKLADAGVEARALATGVSVAVNPVIAPGVVKAPHQARRLLDMLTVNDAPNGLFSYLRQTVRTNNAMTVLPGAVKPTSVFTPERIEGSTDVVAHLSEPVPVRWFDEAPLLEDFLTGEMTEGLLDANSEKVIAAILADGGVANITYVTSPLNTVRKAITAMQTASVEPAALVFTPANWETLDNAAAAAGVESIRPAGGRQLYGVPVVLDNGLTANQGLILAADTVEVYATGGVAVEFSSAFTREVGEAVVTGFMTNEVVCRAENRIKAAVKRPFAARKIALTA